MEVQNFRKFLILLYPFSISLLHLIYTNSIFDTLWLVNLFLFFSGSIFIWCFILKCIYNNFSLSYPLPSKISGTIILAGMFFVCCLYMFEYWHKTCTSNKLLFSLEKESIQTILCNPCPWNIATYMTFLWRLKYRNQRKLVNIFSHLKN